MPILAGVAFVCKDGGSVRLPQLVSGRGGGPGGRRFKRLLFLLHFRVNGLRVAI